MIYEFEQMEERYYYVLVELKIYQLDEMVDK